MDQVLRGLTLAYNYIDDMLIAGKEAEEHKCPLRKIFECLQDQGIIINLSKCKLDVPQLQFLGHQIDS